MNYFLNFKFENEKKHNFKSLLERTYQDENNIIHEIQLNHSFYRKLKEFYNYFNYESYPKTFTEGIFNKYKMDNLRIITEHDLKIAFPDIYAEKKAEISIQKNERMLENFIFKSLNYLNFDIPSKKKFNSNIISNNRPIEWNLFYRIAEEFVIKNKLEKSDLDENLRDFSILLEKKDLDFDYYQTLYKKTKRNVFYSTMKDLFYSTRDTNSNVLE
jgi:hypothetical protein